MVENQQAAPNASQTDQQLLWMKGDFEGEVTGNQNKSGSSCHSRLYLLSIDNGTVKNWQEADAPPQTGSEGELPPLMQAQTSKVIIEDADSVSERTSLIDFQLHDWHWIGHKEISRFAGQVLIGRVAGTAYFQLAEGVPENVSDAEGDISNHSSSACFVYNLWVHAVLSGLLWLYCDIVSAAIYAGGVATACMLMKAFRKFESERLYLLVILGAISVIGIIWQYQMPCSERSVWLLLGSLIPVLLAFMISACVQKGLLILLWLIAVAIWCPACSVTHVRVSPEDAVHHPAITMQDQHIISEKSTAWFGLNKAQLRPQAVASLKQLAAMFVKYPQYNLKIVGHTDQYGENSPVGVAHNYELSQQRADAVASWLVKHGKVDKQRISTIGMGAKSPIIAAPKNDKEFAINRRVEIQVKMRQQLNVVEGE